MILIPQQGYMASVALATRRETKGRMPLLQPGHRL